jgi:hypothetical protein
VIDASTDLPGAAVDEGQGSDGNEQLGTAASLVARTRDRLARIHAKSSHQQVEWREDHMRGAARPSSVVTLPLVRGAISSPSSARSPSTPPPPRSEAEPLSPSFGGDYSPRASAHLVSSNAVVLTPLSQTQGHTQQHARRPSHAMGNNAATMVSMQQMGATAAKPMWK